MEIKIPIVIDDEALQKAIDKRVAEIKQDGDFVIVTRCKDCKYYQQKNSLGTQGICVCGEKDMNYSSEFYPYKNDFCSYAEPKEIEGREYESNF